MIKREELVNPGSCLNKAREDEMVYCIIGHDPALPAALRAWIAERIRLGKNKPDDQQIVDTQNVIDRAIKGEWLRHPIPMITSPSGEGWHQPDRTKITIVDDKTAQMTTRTFQALAEYSSSMPSGVYAGKIWRRHDGAHDYNFTMKGGVPTWMVCWYSDSEKPEHCTINMRLIELTDGDITKFK